MPRSAGSGGVTGFLSENSASEGLLRSIGFYWTLPVPWAGFTKLPKSVEDASKHSRSIRYQAQRVRRWVKEESCILIHEEAFLETQADRGTSAVLPEVERLLKMAEAQDAQLVLVNFADAFHWRAHSPLWSRLQGDPRVMALDPAPLLMDGAWFTPVEHFRSWQDISAAHAALKPQVRAALAARLQQMKGEGKSFAEISRVLNAEGVTTPNGKPWRADNLRKLIAVI
jgi:hypothetical protein